MALAEGSNALRAKCDGGGAGCAASIHERRDAGAEYSHLRPLPVFLIAGPPRTGTSWLHEVLQPHARLPAPTKETRFFDMHYERGWDWYLDHFPEANSSLPAGEVAPTYFASALARGRIARMMPQVRLVFIFRHPAQRLVSLYRLKRAYGMIGCSLEEALRLDPELMGSSQYATHLAEWQSCFPAHQIQVNLYEDMRQDPQSFVNRIAEFLGIQQFRLRKAYAGECQPHSSAGMTEPKWYPATRAATAIADWCKGRNLDNLVAGVRNSRLSRLLLGGGQPLPEIRRETMQRIAGLLLPETERLEAMLGRDLSGWKHVPE